MVQQEEARLKAIIPGDEWICLVLKKLDIDPALVARVNIDARPGEPLEINVTYVNTGNMLEVRPPESDEAMIYRVREGEANERGC